MGVAEPVVCEINRCGVLAEGRCSRCSRAFCVSHHVYDLHTYSWRTSSLDEHSLPATQTRTNLCVECVSDQERQRQSEQLLIVDAQESWNDALGINRQPARSGDSFGPRDVKAEMSESWKAISSGGPVVEQIRARLDSVAIVPLIVETWSGRRRWEHQIGTGRYLGHFYRMAQPGDRSGVALTVIESIVPDYTNWCWTHDNRFCITVGGPSSEKANSSIALSTKPIDMGRIEIERLVNPRFQ